MAEIPKSKVGIIACSGEEIPEGTITRLAALKVLEALRPHETVTICLPLFLAGGKGDRAFARLHPTIAVDGCEKRCAARGTEMYSAKPAVSIVVTEGAPAESSALGNARSLNEKGKQLVSAVADQIARHVDELLDLKRDQGGRPTAELRILREGSPRQAACSCGSGIPTQTLRIAGREVTLIALPLLFAQFRRAGRVPDDVTKTELMRAVKIYNSISDEDLTSYEQAIMREYSAFCARSR
ncbi:MAG: putative zinc-binding protein [Terriglobia bacterium]